MASAPEASKIYFITEPRLTGCARRYGALSLLSSSSGSWTSTSLCSWCTCEGPTSKTLADSADDLAACSALCLGALCLCGLCLCPLLAERRLSAELGVPPQCAVRRKTGTGCLPRSDARLCVDDALQHDCAPGECGMAHRMKRVQLEVAPIEHTQLRSCSVRLELCWQRAGRCCVVAGGGRQTVSLIL